MSKITALVLIIGAAFPALSQNLMVTPRRVVFEERTRSAEVTLINRSAETAVYRVSFTEKRMNPRGTLEPVDQAEWSAGHMIRFAPRQVTLGPGESQQIRLLLRKPANLKSGEYRSHMVFRAVPDPSTGLDAETLVSGRGDIGIRLTPVYGISIPVIVRQGHLAARVAITTASFQRGGEDQPARVDLDFQRLGDASVYGDIQATFVPEDKGQSVVVGKAHGMAIYPDVPSRSLSLDLTTPDGFFFHKGRLVIAYQTPSPDTQILAKHELVITEGM